MLTCGLGLKCVCVYVIHFVLLKGGEWDGKERKKELREPTHTSGKAVRFRSSAGG